MIFLFRFSFFLSEILSFFGFFCTFDNSVIKSIQARQASTTTSTYIRI